MGLEGSPLLWPWWNFVAAKRHGYENVWTVSHYLSVFVIVQRERLCLSSRCRQASFAVFGWSSSWKWQSNKTFGLCWAFLPEQGAFTQRSTSTSVWWKHMLKVFQPTSHLVSVPRRCCYRRYNLHFFKTSHFVATLCDSSWLNLRCIYGDLIFNKSEYISNITYV